MSKMSRNRLNVYTVDQHGVVAIKYNKDDVVIFHATTQAKGELFMEAYLALSLENRRKLVEAVSIPITASPDAAEDKSLGANQPED